MVYYEMSVKSETEMAVEVSIVACDLSKSDHEEIYTAWLPKSVLTKDYQAPEWLLKSKCSELHIALSPGIWYFKIGKFTWNLA